MKWKDCDDEVYSSNLDNYFIHLIKFGEGYVLHWDDFNMFYHCGTTSLEEAKTIAEEEIKTFLEERKNQAELLLKILKEE